MGPGITPATLAQQELHRLHHHHHHPHHHRPTNLHITAAIHPQLVANNAHRPPTVVPRPIAGGPPMISALPSGSGPASFAPTGLPISPMAQARFAPFPTFTPGAGPSRTTRPAVPRANSTSPDALNRSHNAASTSTQPQAQVQLDSANVGTLPPNLSELRLGSEPGPSTNTNTSWNPNPSGSSASPLTGSVSEYSDDGNWNTDTIRRMHPRQLAAISVPGPTSQASRGSPASPLTAQITAVVESAETSVASTPISVNRGGGLSAVSGLGVGEGGRLRVFTALSAAGNAQRQTFSRPQPAATSPRRETFSNGTGGGGGSVSPMSISPTASTPTPTTTTTTTAAVPRGVASPVVRSSPMRRSMAGMFTFRNGGDDTGGSDDDVDMD